MKKFKFTIRRYPALVYVLPLFVVLACIASVREVQNKTKPHGWWEERGPVVPHDAFPADCSLCHTGDDWNTLRDDFEFDHLAQTGVELKGAHEAAECLRCHNDRGPVEAFSGRGCGGCHEDFHMGKLGNDCSACHEEFDWRVKEVIAIHDRTRFPLVGSHASAQCWRCHEAARDGVFTNASSDCETCHQDDLARATMPDHMAQGLTSGCDDCHIPTAWAGASFDHQSFALTGAHSSAACGSCHVNNVFSGTPRDCNSCHMAEYLSTTSPGHVAAGFPSDCSICHTTVAWQGALFDHPSYALTGAHVSTDCNSCHINGVYAGTPRDCNSCHMADYLGTTDPPHMASGFSNDCMECHDTTSWNNAVFDHSSFPLTGAHVGADCTLCHVGGVYAGTPRDCYACHSADYNATSMPNHMSAGFPTDCAACHTTTGWDGAVFDHDFPIDSGAHRNLDCMDCHTTPQNFMAFSCIDCHEHRQSEADDEHKDVNGYSYDSNSCYACHPNGR